MKITKEEKQLGGRNSTSKIYYCEVCNGIGKSNRFVEAHLATVCDGIQKRKCKASTKNNQHRLPEALINTNIWRKKKLIQETNLLYKEFKAGALKDIENMREINATVVEDMVTSFYGGTFF
jgi:hypothetical protein